MAHPIPPSVKGARQADAILEATLRCLGRDGYSATSLQRIANEAGVQKRMIIYYFGGREQLLDQAVRKLGDRLLGQVEDAIQGLEEPADIVSVGFARLWDGLTSDRPLLIAYFGLVAESVTNDRLRATTAHVSDGYRRLIARLVANARARGRELAMDQESLTVLIIAGTQGLTLEYLERGETPALLKAIKDFQRWLTAVSQPLVD